jgi:hypothetical protein
VNKRIYAIAKEQNKGKPLEFTEEEFLYGNGSNTYRRMHPNDAPKPGKDDMGSIKDTKSVEMAFIKSKLGIDAVDKADALAQNPAEPISPTVGLPPKAVSPDQRVAMPL